MRACGARQEAQRAARSTTTVHVTLCETRMMKPLSSECPTLEAWFIGRYARTARLAGPDARRPGRVARVDCSCCSERPTTIPCSPPGVPDGKPCVQFIAWSPRVLACNSAHLMGVPRRVHLVNMSIRYSLSPHMHIET